MDQGDASKRLLEEVQRAVRETRTALGAMAMRNELPHTLMSVCTLIDRTSYNVTWEDGKSSFILDETRSVITFRGQTLKHVVERTDELAEEVGYLENQEKTRIVQLAVNLFVLHELLHITQNFPHYASVALIKGGLRDLGLPVLDVAADTVAAWVTAHVECERTGQTENDEILRAYANMLVISYVLGAFVFNVVGRTPKMQRALGLIVSSLMAQAKSEGRLLEDHINPAWKPISPLLVLDINATHNFNAVVIDALPGMLISNYETSEKALLAELWTSVGKLPVQETMRLSAKVLIRFGVIEGARRDDRGQFQRTATP